MSSDPEIDAIVAAAMKGAKPGADADAYREIAIKSRSEFLSLRENFEREITAAERKLAESDPSDQVHARRRALEHTLRAQEIHIRIIPLAARMSMGGDASYSLSLEELKARLKVLEKPAASSRSGSGCLSAVALISLGIVAPLVSALLRA